MRAFAIGLVMAAQVLPAWVVPGRDQPVSLRKVVSSSRDQRIASYDRALMYLHQADMALISGLSPLARQLLSTHSTLASIWEGTWEHSSPAELLHAAEATKWVSRAQQALELHDSPAARRDVQRAERSIRRARMHAISLEAPTHVSMAP